MPTIRSLHIARETEESREDDRMDPIISLQKSRSEAEWVIPTAVDGGPRPFISPLA